MFSVVAASFVLIFLSLVHFVMMKALSKIAYVSAGTAAWVGKMAEGWGGGAGGWGWGEAE